MQMRKRKAEADPDLHKVSAPLLPKDRVQKSQIFSLIPPSSPLHFGTTPLSVKLTGVMSSSAEAAAAEAAAQIEANFVGRTSIVHIPDGRAFCGTFLCVDSGSNIILSDTDELRLTSSGGTSSRNVGMVMIPGNCVVKIEVQRELPQHAAPTSEPAPLSGSMAQAGWPDDDSMYA
ncbi:hypothetical protein L1887_50574 [Cichorium endivia]|nr:hypothetical protein L1887_50574 [Cichorium endivia]